MGCKTSKEVDGGQPGGSNQQSAGTPNQQSGGDARISFLSGNVDQGEFRERLFVSCGTVVKYNSGDVLIEEAKTSDAALYIKKGTVVLKKAGTDKEVAKRTKGDLIGEMTFLLGDVPGVSVVADGPVEVCRLEHSEMMEMLTKDPGLAGRLFKMMAVTLSERIAEASAKMRNEVVAKTAKKKESKAGGAAASMQNVAKYRQLFGLKKEEQLLLRTTCSMRKEANALKDANVQFGDLYVFENHLCFDWKVFGFHRQQTLDLLEVLALLKSHELPNTVEVQGKGYSYELTVPENFEAAWSIMEACRRNTSAMALQTQAAEDVSQKPVTKIFEDVDGEIANAFDTGEGRRGSLQAGQKIKMDLTDQDWMLLMSGAKQRKYKKGDCVLEEGQSTAALFQILQGSLRVELKMKSQTSGATTSVVVGHRGSGDMFGETSLLQAGKATASIICDSDTAVLCCIEGTYMEELFANSPNLPGRFFAFLAGYQARRLRQLTELVSKNSHEIMGGNAANVQIEDVFSNPAYMGIFRKFMFHAADEDPDQRDTYAMALAMFEFWMDVQDFKSEPDIEEMRGLGQRILANFIVPDAPMLISAFEVTVRDQLIQKVEAAFKDGPVVARKVFDPAQQAAVSAMESMCYGQFLASEHFAYILELKSKEGFVPGLADFRLIRVLGQGGFGQVLEVVKRDCGKRYAMKVMHKEMMRRCLGSSWRKKIWLEKDLLACLCHPFLVNLLYAFQNQEFLVLVMDLVPAGDLSEFVLTKKRLTADQVRFCVMEVVCVIAYCHAQNVLYRDLKPENLLIDEAGHVRLIDMGLAARINKKTPKRKSRVGTDCYMAPEVRWAKDRREWYGLSCDWYTVGVLTYEFSAGAVPFARPDEDSPVYRHHDFADPACESLVKGLLDQDHRTRLGCGAAGAQEILDHPYWRGIEWELVPLKKFESPCKGLKGPPKRKKEKENQAVQIANDISEAEREEADAEYNVGNWDFTSPNAIIEEYMENMYQCVSSI